jgi:hypothetical protein
VREGRREGEGGSWAKGKGEDEGERGGRGKEGRKGEKG